MATPTWVNDPLFLPGLNLKRLQSLIHRWDDYRESYQAKYDYLVARGWTFHDVWEEIPKYSHATEIQFEPSNPDFWTDLYGTEWLPGPGELNPGIPQFFDELVENGTFYVDWLYLTNLPTGMGGTGIAESAFTAGRVLLRMFQLSVAQCLENVFCLDSRGRPPLG